MGCQHWLEAYAHALQQVEEAAEGRCWMPRGKNFLPMVSMLVEAFIGMSDMLITPDSTVNCWSSHMLYHILMR